MIIGFKVLRDKVIEYAKTVGVDVKCNRDLAYIDPFLPIKGWIISDGHNRDDEDTHLFYHIQDMNFEYDSYSFEYIKDCFARKDIQYAEIFAKTLGNIDGMKVILLNCPE